MHSFEALSLLFKWRRSCWKSPHSQALAYTATFTPISTLSMQSCNYFSQIIRILTIDYVFYLENLYSSSVKAYPNVIPFSINWLILASPPWHPKPGLVVCVINSNLSTYSSGLLYLTVLHGTLHGTKSMLISVSLAAAKQDSVCQMNKPTVNGEIIAMPEMWKYWKIQF